MNELIPITYTNDRPTVSGRALHEALEVKTAYKDWFPRMVGYGFTEGADFNPLKNERVQLEGKREVTRIVEDHQLTIDMAKELCMIQRTDKGRECRQYFLAVEKQWNSPEAVMARALKLSERLLEEAKGEVKRLKAENASLVVDVATMEPKAEYFDELVDRNLLTSFRETAKLLGVPQKKFINFLLEHRYLYRDQKGALQAYVKHKTDGLFECKECFNEKTANIVRKHYGWAGQLFIQRLEDEEDGLLDELKQEYEGMVQVLTTPAIGKKISGKQANAASVLLNAAYYVQKYVFEGYETKGLNVMDILPFLQDEREISVGKRAYDFILDWIGTNVNSFVDEHRCGQNGEYQLRRLEDVKGKLYGKIRTDDVTLIIKSVFEAALMDNGYSPEPVYKWLRANGKLALARGTSNMQSIGGTLLRCVPIYTAAHDFTTSLPDI